MGTTGRARPRNRRRTCPAGWTAWLTMPRCEDSPSATHSSVLTKRLNWLKPALMPSSSSSSSWSRIVRQHVSHGEVFRDALQLGRQAARPKHRRRHLPRGRGRTDPNARVVAVGVAVALQINDAGRSLPLARPSSSRSWPRRGSPVSQRCLVSLVLAAIWCASDAGEPLLTRSLNSGAAVREVSALNARSANRPLSDRAG